jgi:hypothetical protein
MDDYRQDSVYTSDSGLSPGSFKTLTPAETTSYRNWRRALVAFYSAVLLVGGLALLASIPVSNREVAQVMPQAMPAVNVP